MFNVSRIGGGPLLQLTVSKGGHRRVGETIAVTQFMVEETQVDTQPEERPHRTHVPNDLAELKGIGPKYAEMLKSIGVDSIKELSHRNPTRLKEMIETRHGKVVGLSEHTCQTWIEEAKALAAAPTSPAAPPESDRE